jgi:hypothetical protein
MRWDDRVAAKGAIAHLAQAPQIFFILSSKLDWTLGLWYILLQKGGTNR